MFYFNYILVALVNCLSPSWESQDQIHILLIDIDCVKLKGWAYILCTLNFCIRYSARLFGSLVKRRESADPNPISLIAIVWSSLNCVTTTCTLEYAMFVFNSWNCPSFASGSCSCSDSSSCSFSGSLSCFFFGYLSFLQLVCQFFHLLLFVLAYSSCLVPCSSVIMHVLSFW